METISELRELISTPKGQADLYARLKADFYPMCYKMTDNLFMADETFMKVTKRVFDVIGTRDDIETPFAYFSDMYRHGAINELREDKCAGMTDITAVVMPKVVTFNTFLNDANAADANNRLNALFDRNTIEIVCLRRDGYKFREIVDMVGMNKETIKARYYRALSVCKERFGDE